MNKGPRLAFIVSHPIQYYVPLYKRLSHSSDIDIKVFYTWHDARSKVMDNGFKKEIAWDIPLVDSYKYELVPNLSKDPGTHHFFGLSNPELLSRVNSWHPDAVHITGYAWYSHLLAIRKLSNMGVPVLFRGDSHLLDNYSGFKSWIKKKLLSTIYQYPKSFLYVGRNNYNYYKFYGVPEYKLFFCPHSIDMERYASSSEELEKRALEWRRKLNIDDNKTILLFAGKLERKKQPLELMQAFCEMNLSDTILLVVGDGNLKKDITSIMVKHPSKFRYLPFQNQSLMPVLYRMGNLFVLPSSDNETWGLSINEAMACSRAVIVSNKVGCAEDLVKPGITGEIFNANNWDMFKYKLSKMLKDKNFLELMGCNAYNHIQNYSIEKTEAGLLEALAYIISG